MLFPDYLQLLFRQTIKFCHLCTRFLSLKWKFYFKHWVFFVYMYILVKALFMWFYQSPKFMCFTRIEIMKIRLLGIGKCKKKKEYWNAGFHATVQVWHGKEEESMSVVNWGQKIDRLCDKYHSCRLYIIAQKLQACFKSGVQDQAQAMPYWWS